jgi:hypothetical protein
MSIGLTSDLKVVIWLDDIWSNNYLDWTWDNYL